MVRAKVSGVQKNETGGKGGFLFRLRQHEKKGSWNLNKERKKKGGFGKISKAIRKDPWESEVFVAVG